MKRNGSGGNLSGARDGHLPEERLLQYAEGRLPPEESRAVEAHLRECPACARTLEALRVEERLLYEALEPLEEPEGAPGERVLRILSAEARRSLRRLQAGKWRRAAAALVAAAAMLAVIAWWSSPPLRAGLFLGGEARLIDPAGRGFSLRPNRPFRVGDVVETGRGKQARLRLDDGSLVELDERTRLSFRLEGPAFRLRLERGRCRITTPESCAARFAGVLTARTKAVSTRLGRGTTAELWLAEPCKATVPRLLAALPETLPVFRPEAAKKRETTADGTVLTVERGAVAFRVAEDSSEQTLGSGRRALFVEGVAEPRLSACRPPEFGEWLREGLMVAEPPAVRPLPVLGFDAVPDWYVLGRRAGLLRRLPGGVETESPTFEQLREALDKLAATSEIRKPLARAAALAEGGALLRQAVGALELHSPRRCSGRILEGLAHFERGLIFDELRVAAEEFSGDRDEKPRHSAGLDESHNAFLAAAVAFEEGLETTEEATAGTEKASSVAAGNFELTGRPTLKQTARFLLPWARFRAALTPAADERDAERRLRELTRVETELPEAAAGTADGEETDKKAAADKSAKKLEGVRAAAAAFFGAVERRAATLRRAADQLAAVRPKLGGSLEALEVRCGEGRARAAAFRVLSRRLVWEERVRRWKAALAGGVEEAPEPETFDFAGESKLLRTRAREALEEVFFAPLTGLPPADRAAAAGLRESAAAGLLRLYDTWKNTARSKEEQAEARRAAEEIKRQLLYRRPFASPAEK